VSVWISDPAAIYAESFATIRAEADLACMPADLADLMVRVIHACGMTDIAADLAWSDGAGLAGAQALKAGAPILVDAEMVAHGIIRRNLPAANQVICTLNEVTQGDAKAAGTTRSALAVEKWLPYLAGSVVAVGNAPTALFRLLELIEGGAPRPALILGFAVGFVGAVESKEALIASGLAHVALRGRRGGSAMAAASVNALAGGLT
jgi:precorrin-8X/cobalt-precorrin-8 methylmutase